MVIGKHNTAKKVFIIAEIGNNHEGDVERARAMIRSAAQCGVDAVKLQTFKTELLINRSDTERFAKLKSFELTYDEFRQLAEAAAKEGVVFLSTPFDCQSARFLNEIVPAFKISSGDNTFYPLIECVAQTGKPIIISCGLIGMRQIKKIRAYIEGIWKKNNLVSELAMLHCVVNYPVEVSDVNLLAVKYMCDSLDCVVGYSDHSLGIEAAAASVAFGARIIEKHFTLDKNFSKFRDHRLSADPAEMAELVRRVRTLEKAIGTGEVNFQQCEKGFEAVVRRSIVAAKNLTQGHTLTLGDITWVRPAGGLPPGNEKILGKKLKHNIGKGELILLKHCVDARRKI